MSSRTLRIMENARKRKCSDNYSDTEMTNNEDKLDVSPPSSPRLLQGATAPEYAFLYDETFDDEDRDPDFEPSCSDVSDDSDVSNKENNETASNRIKKKNQYEEILQLDEDVQKNYDMNGDVQIIMPYNENKGNNEIDKANQVDENEQVNEIINEEQKLMDVNDPGEENVMENPDNFNNEQQTEEILEKPKKPKRHRSVEDQMRNNSQKHHVKEPCECKLKCYEKITHESMNRHFQRVWLSSKIKEMLTKRKLREGSRRNITRKYVLPVKELDNTVSDTDVCQNFFLRTLGYGNANILTTLSKALRDPNGNKRIVPLEDKRGRHSPANKKDRHIIIAHINGYNPRISHYTREHAPNRRYLPPDLTTKFMHTDYCNTNPEHAVSYEVYRSTLDKMIIGFYEPTPEKCGFCQEMDLNPTEENLRLKAEHLDKVSQIRELYKNDSAIPVSDAVVFAADMQKVVLLPRMPDVKETFFNSRLITFNETYASMQKKGRHHLILWHEAIAGRRAEDVASAFIKFLILNRDAEKIIVWMDNCTAQNKNFALYSAVLCYINSEYYSTKEILIEYLIKGHTFMAADGLHGRIEQAMRKVKNVYDFNDFKEACQKSSTRTVLTCMHTEDFFKFTNIIRSRKSKGQDTLPYFKDVTAAKLTRGSSNFLYQLLPAGEFLTTDNTLKKKANLRMPDRVCVPRGIAVDKKALIIKELVPKMLENRRQFWLTLEKNTNSEDLLNEGF